jgi:hypothetical protein
VDELRSDAVPIHAGCRHQGKHGEQLVQVDAPSPGEVVERLQVSELRRPVFGLAVATQHLPPDRVVRSHLADGHARADRGLVPSLFAEGMPSG